MSKTLRTVPRMRDGHIFESIFDVKIWEDTESYSCSDVRSSIEAFCLGRNYDCIGVYHSSDGKAHYHYTFKCDNPRYLDLFCSRFGIPQDHISDISWKSDFRLSVRYLFHFDNPEKALYSNKDVVFSNFNYLKYLNNLSETDGAQLIVAYIEDNCIHRVSDLMPFIFENDLYSTFRRGIVIFKEVMRNV